MEIEIENKRRFSLFVLKTDFLVDSIPATMMLWLLVFYKIDVNCLLQANGKQMLSRKKNLGAHSLQHWASCCCARAATSAWSRTPSATGQERKGFYITLSFTDLGIFETRHLHTLIKVVLLQVCESIFRADSRVTAGSITHWLRLDSCKCKKCECPGPSIPSINLHSWMGFSRETKRLYLH